MIHATPNQSLNFKCIREKGKWGENFNFLLQIKMTFQFYNNLFIGFIHLKTI